MLSSRRAGTSRGSFFFSLGPHENALPTRLRSEGEGGLAGRTLCKLGRHCLFRCPKVYHVQHFSSTQHGNQEREVAGDTSTVNLMIMLSRCCCPWNNLPRGEYMMTKSNNTLSATAALCLPPLVYVMVYSYSIHGVCCLPPKCNYIIFYLGTLLVSLGVPKISCYSLGSDASLDMEPVSGNSSSPTNFLISGVMLSVQASNSFCFAFGTKHTSLALRRQSKSCSRCWPRTSSLQQQHWSRALSQSDSPLPVAHGHPD